MSCGISATCPAVRSSYLLHLIGQLSSGFLHLCPIGLQEMRVHTNHMGDLPVLVTCLRGKVCEHCQRRLMAKPKVNIIEGYSSPGSIHISFPPKTCDDLQVHTQTLQHPTKVISSNVPHIIDSDESTTRWHPGSTMAASNSMTYRITGPSWESALPYLS